MEMRKVRARITVSFSWDAEVAVHKDETMEEALEMQRSILQDEEPVDTSLERYANARGWRGDHTVTVTPMAWEGA